jgi:NAD(P)-dependent dehydrogenase (short-subunit alcohol dehydrogenase family)
MAVEIRDKVAVVTGAASGIGRAAAIALAEAGANVVLADLDDAGLEEVRNEVEGRGRKAIAVHTDVSKVENVQSLFDQSVHALGRVDILMNNAGVRLDDAPVDKYTLADWQWIVGVNIWGVINGVTVFLPHMLERGSGHIVNTASLAGIVGGLDSIPYTTTKFAVVALSQGLAIQLKRRGIGVSVLVPGVVVTGMGNNSRFIPFEDGLDDARRMIRDSVVNAMSQEIPEQAKDAVIPAEQAAAAVVRAIRENIFMVHTHEAQRNVMEQLAALQVKNPGAVVDMWAELKAQAEESFLDLMSGKLDLQAEMAKTRPTLQETVAAYFPEVAHST